MPAECFLPTVVIVSLGSFIRVEDARQEVWVYHDEYVHHKLPDVSSEVVSEDSDDVFNGDLDNGNWAVADLGSTPEGAVPGRTRKIRQSFRPTQ